MQLQRQVLDLLAQLVQLRVNYCLLDSDQVSHWAFRLPCLLATWGEWPQGGATTTYGKEGAVPPPASASHQDWPPGLARIGGLPICSGLLGSPWTLVTLARGSPIACARRHGMLLSPPEAASGT